ncbi:DUF4810 domain-containing protein [Acinetobacter pseudolwoffii]|nr:DUF4810 domain-containing protein [Acinetobacter pseudolwoffii]ENW23013.1 hypothetical protein F925_02888 [Acinetobacter lwoffii NCTC 5866 = CIP 64.10 = NIPH 512]MCP0912139.1 DUF4810 domain-containing protein [Acinetobacter pseudolwoffii]MDH5819877.1 DUF4810 domain-containing protein [Acinetobacter pseudolwoffii]PJI35845.1 DUF4810 domain-containing protein [Acinetobacter pseudolwoffii]
MKNIFLLLGAVMSLSLVGCASGPKSLYSWGTYPQQTYLLLSVPEKTSPQEQIAKLEKDIEKAKAKNAAVPPGLYAHLGLLNLNLNNGPRAVEYFELERQVYPESTVLMDRLLKKMTSQTIIAGAKK